MLLRSTVIPFTNSRAPLRAEIERMPLSVFGRLVLGAVFLSATFIPGIASAACDAPPKLTATIVEHGGIQARVRYGFAAASLPAERSLTLAWLPAPGVPGGSVSTMCELGLAGECIVPLAPESGQTLVHFKAACGGRVTAAIAVMPSGDRFCSCDLAAAAPRCALGSIHVASGNFRHAERDPLPGEPGLPLTRTYDSSSSASGVFGNGWHSPFDAGIAGDGDSDPRPLIHVVTESGDSAVFSLEGWGNGRYEQKWPSGVRDPGTLRFDAGTGTYVHRQAGSRFSRIFDAAQGRLVGYALPAESSDVRISYAADGMPMRIGDASGRWGWTVIADPAGRVGSIVADGRPDLSWTYAYDAAGNLLSASLSGTPAWRRYEYATRNLVAVRNAAGHILAMQTYDGRGRATSAFSPQGAIDTIEYELPGHLPGERITRVAGTNGSTTEYLLRDYAGRARSIAVEGPCSCGTPEATSGLDEHGRLIREQDARGYITVFTYTAAGLQSRLQSVDRGHKPAGCNPETDPGRCRLDSDGLLTAALEPAREAVRTAFAYGDDFWPEQATEISTASVLVSGRNRRETFTYDAASGAPLTRTVSGWTGLPPRPESRTTTTRLYDGIATAAFVPGGAFDPAWLSLPQPRGLRRSLDGPRRDVFDTIESVYYPVAPAVPATWRGRLAAVRDAAGSLTRFDSYDAFGNPGTTTDANGVVTDRGRDGLGRSLVETLRAQPGCDMSLDPLCQTALTSALTYEPAAGPRVRSMRPNGAGLALEYDTMGRPLAVVRAPYAEDPLERLEIEHDPATGKVTSERRLGNHDGVWTEAQRVMYQYDDAGRLVRKRYPPAPNSPAGAEEIFSYDPAGNLASFKDATHAEPHVFFSYDALGRLSLARQVGSEVGAAELRTAYSYDAHDNLCAIIDPAGNRSDVLTDDFGAAIRKQSLAAGVRTFLYDPAGNRTSARDANGAVTIRYYDAANRIVSASAARPGLETEVITWSYDEPVSGTLGQGRLTSMSDSTGVTRYAYERRGLRREQSGPRGTLRFAYDENGNRTSIAYPSGRIVNYDYDHADRPYAARAGSTVYVLSADYAPFGPATRLRFGNGTAQNTVFDSRYRPLTHAIGDWDGEVELAAWVSIHDDSGRLVELEDSLDPAYFRSFGYDDFGRLTAADSGNALWGTGRIEYDGGGRPSALHFGARRLAFSYEGSSPRLATVDENGLIRTVAHDAAGNEIAAGDVVSQYSPRNLLTREGDLSYVYDGNGQRVAASDESDPLAVRHAAFVYGPEGELLHERQSTNSSSVADDPEEHQHEYVWFGGAPVAQEDSSGTTWTCTDPQGAPALQTDSSGTVVWRAEYDPLGGVHALRSPDRHQPLRGAGREAEQFFGGMNGATERSYALGGWYRYAWGRMTQPRSGVPETDSFLSESGVPLQADSPRVHSRLRIEAATSMDAAFSD